jgi:hypothetical protein
MEGMILSPEEAVARNPDIRVSREVRDGKAYWVLLTLFEKEVSVELEAWQIATAAETSDQS